MKTKTRTGAWAATGALLAFAAGCGAAPDAAQSPSSTGPTGTTEPEDPGATRSASTAAETPVPMVTTAPPVTDAACNRDNLTECSDRCDKGDATSCFRKASLLQRGARFGGPEEAEYVAIYQRTCDSQGPNTAEACGRLAYILLLSPTVKNELRAFELGKKGCELGSKLGCLFLGREHRTSAWPTRLAWLERACTLGEPDGCVEGGVIAIEGRDGLAPETARGLRLLDGACNGGNATACAHLAFLHDRGSIRNGKPTEVKPDAAKWDQYTKRYCALGAKGHHIDCPQGAKP